MESIFDIKWLGCVDFLAAWELQKTLAEQRRTGEIPDTLLLLEHPPTLSLGRAFQEGNILATPETLAAENFAVVACDRGGDVTYHGPGQLVGYPILHLQQPPHTPDLHLYLRNIEEVLIRALAAFGLQGSRFPGYTGVWVGMETPTPRKIAAIGIKTSRWVTQHGFSLNVCPNMAHFAYIVPCGITDYGVTSLTQELGRPVEIAGVLPIVQQQFGEVFGLKAKNSG